MGVSQSDMQTGGPAERVPVVVVGGRHGQVLQRLQQGIQAFNAAPSDRPVNARQPVLASPTSVDYYRYEEVSRALGNATGIVVVVLHEPNWSLGGMDGTPRKLSESVQLAYDVLDNCKPIPTVALALDPMLGTEEDPQFTGLCVLAWMCSEVAALVDQIYLNLPTVITNLATAHQDRLVGGQRALLIGRSVAKLEKFRESSFNQRSPAHLVIPYELSWRGAFRTALALAQLDSLPAGRTQTGRRSYGGPTLAAELNKMADLSLFEYHPGGLDDLIRRLEAEWCVEDESRELYVRPMGRARLPTYARKEGGFPRHQPIIRSVEHRATPGALYQALNEIDMRSGPSCDDIPCGWYTRPAYR